MTIITDLNMSIIEARLRAIGVVLTTPAPPVASYLPVAIHGDIAYVSGQLPRDESGLVTGRVGGSLSVTQAKAAARLCAIAVLAALREALDGELDRVAQCLQLNGFVASDRDFEAHSEIINGASDLMAQVFGPAGLHARAAIGVSSLPFGVPVEVSAVFALRRDL